MMSVNGQDPKPRCIMMISFLAKVFVGQVIEKGICLFR